MKKTLFIIAGAGILFASLSCTQGSETITEKDVNTPSIQATEQTTETKQISEDVDAGKFKSLIDGGAGIIIDVRTPGEYAGGNIPGSVNIDFNGSGFEAALDTLDKSVPVYVYCQSGGRSGQAKKRMSEKGFSEVYNLVGGYGNWPYKQ